MADAVAQLVLRIESLEAEVAQNRLDKLEQQGKKNESGADRLSSRFSKLSSVVLTLNQGIDLASRAFQLMSNVTNDLTQHFYTQERAAAKVDQVLKSTGGAAGVSQKQIHDLATEMSQFTTVGDELLLNAQAQILTFTQIGEEIFPSVLESALNLSAAYDQDLKGSVLQVSKALNDFSGYSALQRSGVTFTQSQIEMIQGFKEQNDLISYQQLLLKELEKEFGGMARAMRNTDFGLDQAVQNAVGDLKEVFGKGIAEALRPGKKAFVEFVNENIDTLSALFTDIPGVAEIAWNTVKQIAVRTFEWETFADNIDVLGTNTVRIMQASFMYIARSWNTLWEAASNTAGDFGGNWGKAFVNHMVQNIANAPNWVLRIIGKEELDIRPFDLEDNLGDVFLKNMVEEFDTLGDSFVTYLIDIGGIATMTGEDIADNYSDIIAKAIADMQALIARGKADLESLKNDTSVSLGPVDTTETEVNPNQDEIDKIVSQLEREKELYGKSENEILRYKLAKLGASEATIEHVDSLQHEIEELVRADAQTKIFHDSLLSLRDTGLNALTGAFREFGSALADAEEGMMSFDRFMGHIVNTIIQSLPALLMNAGLQLIAQGQWAVGLGLMFSSIPANIAAGYSQSAMNQNAHGNVFDNGNVVPFAQGGVGSWVNQVVSQPTFFPMANGGVGVMGEAGEEGIFPLGRTPSGDLGVKAIGSKGDTVIQLKVDVLNYSGEKVETQLEGDVLKIIVGAVKEDYSMGGFDDINEVRYGVKQRGISA